jgi:hypothetical protein
MKPVLYTLATVSAVVLAVAVAYPRVATTFDISAETEWVEFIPGSQPRSDWLLDSARIFIGEDTVGQPVSGSLRLSDSARVVVQRRSSGPLTLDISPVGTNQHLGDIVLSDSVSTSLHGHAIILLNDIEARSQKGLPIVLPVKGSVIAGRAIEIETEPSPARFRGGRVTSFGKSIFGWTVFSAGTVELTPGDQVSIEAQRSPAFGLIAADERPALSVGYRAIATSVKVRRPGGSDYRIGTSIYDRLAADPVLQVTWLVIGFLLAHILRLKGRPKENVAGGEAG